MTRLVVSGDALIHFGNEPGFFLRAHDDLVDAFVKVFHGYLAAVVACAENCRFVEKVSYIRARKTACYARQNLEIHV